MNENLYIAHKKLPHKTLRVHSARYTHNVQRCVIGLQSSFESQIDL